MMLRLTKLMIILTAGLFAGGAMAQGLPDSGVWTYKKNIDEFTDKVSHSLILTSEEMLASGKKVAMFISCGSNETFIQIITGLNVLNKVYGTKDAWEVDYRIDKLKGNTFKAHSTKVSFFPYPQSTHVPFINEMLNQDKLRMRFVTRNDRETITFKITGIEDAIKPIREACNW